MVNRIIVGITGASGAIYGIRLLEVLRQKNIETHLLVSNPGWITIREEMGIQDKNRVITMANFYYNIDDIASKLASGSFITDGMIIAPCSVKSASAMANSYSDNLLIRAADVVLKEGRKLIILFRESPIHIGHVKILEKILLMGGKVLIPAPGFYVHPRSIDDIVNYTVGRLLDQYGLEHNLFTRWKGIL